MGTRGFITFVVNGEEKTSYNHFDSYPSGLGIKVLEFIREAAKHPYVLREAASRLRLVNQDTPPTAQEIEQLGRYASDRVSSGSPTEWYVLLRGTQGDVAAMLEAGVIEDARNFPLDSLFAEYGYVIMMDGDGMFEVYRGFQHAPHDRGRFAGRREYIDVQQASPVPSGTGLYYPVALWKRWPLAQLPSNEEFLAALKEGDGGW